jgi:trk system potassium uptake protein TrkH
MERVDYRVRPWQRRLWLVVAYQAPVAVVLGLALLLPLLLAAWEAQGVPVWQEVSSYLLPAIVCLVFGFLVWWRLGEMSWSLTGMESLLITTAVWLTTGVIGAMPFILLLGTPVVDALLESVSGFTTAGTTMLTGLDTMPLSIIVWRSLIQWLGGMGILLIVLIVGRAHGGSANFLLSAEGVKISSGRLSLNFEKAAVRFIQIYIVLTLLQTLLTTLLGMSLFDSISHAMTTVATGGFSPHDESIAFYRNRPDIYPFHQAIEVVVSLFMLAGGTNFYVLYRLGRGQLAALWDGLEMRLLWMVVSGATLLAAWNAWSLLGGSFLDWLLRSFFEVASIVSTTGYETTATGVFPFEAKELFLLLMVIGGCAGSTAGGIKLIRLGILGKYLSHEIRLLRSSAHTVHVPTIDGRPISDGNYRQSIFILLLWFCYLAVGGLIITLLAPHLAIADAYSTVFTAIGVFGPSFIPVDQVIALPVLAKLIFIVGMLAGRLEIIPLLVFFNWAAWRQ